MDPKLCASIDTLGCGPTSACDHPRPETSSASVGCVHLDLLPGKCAFLIGRTRLAGDYTGGLRRSDDTVSGLRARRAAAAMALLSNRHSEFRINLSLPGPAHDGSPTGAGWNRLAGGPSTSPHRLAACPRARHCSPSDPARWRLAGGPCTGPDRRKSVAATAGPGTRSRLPGLLT